MICKPIRYRSMDDDYAPVDYSYVRSVSEGAKLRQAQNIPQTQEDGTVVRHNPDPNDRGRSDGYGTRARRSNVVRPQDARHTIQRGIPSFEQGPPPVTRVAYPDPEPEENQEISEAVSECEVEPMQQPSFDPPAKVDMPDWLRVAQQNHMPSQEQRARAPRVQAAPRQQVEEPAATDMLGRPLRRAARPPEPELPQSVREYSAAGYPQELIEEQMKREQQWAEQSGHKRHGAQRAVRAEEPKWEEPRRIIRPAQERTASYPPPRQEMEEADRRVVETREPEWQEPPRTRAGYERTRAYAGGEGDAYPRGMEYEFSQPGYARQGRYAEANEDLERAGYPAQGGAWQGDAAVQPAREHEEDSYAQDETERPWRRNIPWLGIGVAVALFVCIGLWLLQVTFDRTTQGVLTARAEAEQAVANSHPYQYRELIETQAQLNNLHPAFIAAIVLNESSFRPQAESSVGARGLMQMMPDTAEWVHGKMDESATFSFDDMYDPQKNVRYACWYMKFLSDRFSGDPVLVSAAFHSGQGNVQNWLNNSKYSADGRTIDLEDMMDGPTKNYASRVLRDYAVYKRLYYEQQGV